MATTPKPFVIQKFCANSLTISPLKAARSFVPRGEKRISRNAGRAGSPFWALARKIARRMRSSKRAGSVV
jgi:hypothetical protein